MNCRHRRYALSGLAVCGGCGGHLHFHTARSGRARVYCYQSRQGGSCGERSTFVEAIEEQVAVALATFQLPEETVAQLIQFYERTRDEPDDAHRRWRELSGRLERIRELYTWGDMTREAYVAERDRLEAELHASRDPNEAGEIMARAAAFLRNLSAAWAAAPAEQRKALARVVFRAVEITDGRVVAVVPQADFAPFFNLSAAALGSELDERQPQVAASDCQPLTLASGSDGRCWRHRVTAPTLS